ncbi:hypothetical protein PHBOTO_004213 [Pseudozyma hubeiensis]|nr:hypothetical protein PHBOTO_004213 [Pseudozyma hubeiensis]
MGRPRSSLAQSKARKHARRKAIQPDSFLLKHYDLFNSLTRYAQEDSDSTSFRPKRKRTTTATISHHVDPLRTNRLKQRYPLGDVWSYTWPLPLPQLPEHSQTPNERVAEIVEQVVKATFDADYAVFRSPQWAKDHRISQDHLERIVVDPSEVDESATAAKALVETVLGRVIAGVKKGSIGVQGSHSTTLPVDVSSPAASSDRQQADSTGIQPEAVAVEDPELDERELEEEMGRGDNYAMDWRSLLNYLESTAGTSKTSQWRNWHLLNAIAKTRLRCEELFGQQ